MAGGRQPNRCRASCIDTQNFDLPKLRPLRTFSGVAPLSGPAPAVGVSLNGFDKRRMTALQRSEQRVSEAGRIAKGSTNRQGCGRRQPKSASNPIGIERWSGPIPQP
jgi:hypothetical protein